MTSVLLGDVLDGVPDRQLVEQVIGKALGVDPESILIDCCRVYPPSDSKPAINGMIPVAQLRALVALLWPEEITPIAKRMFDSVLEEHDV